MDWKKYSHRSVSVMGESGGLSLSLGGYLQTAQTWANAGVVLLSNL